MKQIASVLLALLAIALPTLGETFLSVSDVHFNPFSDPALVPKLEAADVAEWQGILASSGTTTFTTYGSDINDALFRSAVGEMHTQLPSPAFVLISG
ncbi:MAG TPA: hypothetical protein VM733_21070, partial [Thermoanaerobaculia bacterium]|nr:hypothetical protein [Thermoanaerobaculia bacterium]